MKRISNGNLAKLVAFFLIVVTLTCTVAYAVSGSTNVANDPLLNNPSDNSPPQNNNNLDTDFIPTVKPIPEYLHNITGLEITKEQSYILPLCFIFNPLADIYSISSSYLTIEIPIEHGNSRFICFTDDALSIGKIGALEPSRKNFHPVISSFGGILLSYGIEGRVNFPESNNLSLIDLKENTGYYYTEYNNRRYSNSDLLRALIKNTNTSMITTEKVKPPFIFNGYFEPKVKGNTAAGNITIKYSDCNITNFIYSDETERYVIAKNDTVITDPLNEKHCSYDNLFVLYADSTTYETSDFTECVVSTTCGGSGVYASCGTVQNITWTTSEEGYLIFKDESGNELTVNRGSSFISFVKSSERTNVSIS